MQALGYVVRSIEQNNLDAASNSIAQSRELMLIAANQSHYKFWPYSQERFTQGKVLYFTLHYVIGVVGLELAERGPGDVQEVVQSAIRAFKVALIVIEQVHEAISADKSDIWKKLSRAYVLTREYDEALLAGAKAAGILDDSPEDEQEAASILDCIVTVYSRCGASRDQAATRVLELMELDIFRDYLKNLLRKGLGASSSVGAETSGDETADDDEVVDT
jgi:hypothetical protein